MGRSYCLAHVPGDVIDNMGRLTQLLYLTMWTCLLSIRYQFRTAFQVDSFLNKAPPLYSFSFSSIPLNIVGNDWTTSGWMRVMSKTNKEIGAVTIPSSSAYTNGDYLEVYTDEYTLVGTSTMTIQHTDGGWYHYVLGYYSSRLFAVVYNVNGLTTVSASSLSGGTVNGNTVFTGSSDGTTNVRNM